jgi:hypothetical protein
MLKVPVTVKDGRGEEGEVTALNVSLCRQDAVQLTPYDSPAMWKALPSNSLKVSKNYRCQQGR